MLRTVLASTLGLALLVAPAMVTAAGAPPPLASKDPAAAPAGVYTLDGRHISVIARIGHGNGTSFSTFRFGKARGSLTWDPANPSAIRVNVTVEPASIASNVEGFPAELSGERFLNVIKYPEATFVSTGFRSMGGARAAVDGNLTFMGQTRPMTINAEMVGVGVGPTGKKNIGFTGTMSFKRSDFGFTTFLGPISDRVDILLDGEFNQS